MKNAIFIEILINNIKYKDSEILDLVPNSIFNEDFHFQNCIKIIENLENKNDLNGFNFTEKECLINYFAFKFQIGKIFTSVLFLIENRKAEVKNANIFFKDFFQNDQIEFFNKNLNLGFNISISKVLLKYFASTLFHVLSTLILIRNKKRIFSIVKSWVEVSLRIHGDIRFKNSLVLVYPFPYSVNRQFDFIKTIKKYKYKFTFGYVSYHFSDLIKLLIRRDYKNLIKFECNGEKKSAERLLINYPSLKYFYTEDDYNPAILVFNEVLINAGVQVINTSHGINQQVPIIKATKCEYLNTCQMDIYKKYSPKTIFEKQINHSVSTSLIENKLMDITLFSFVYIHGNYQESGMSYENNLQEKIISKILELNYPNIYIKYHPNVKHKLYSSLKEINSFDSLGRVIFITINSTSYYTFGKLGLFIFVGDDLCKPFSSFGRHIEFINFENFNNIYNYTDYEKWENSFSQQLKNL